MSWRDTNLGVEKVELLMLEDYVANLRAEHNRLLQHLCATILDVLCRRIHSATRCPTAHLTLLQSRRVIDSCPCRYMDKNQTRGEIDIKRLFDDVAFADYVRARAPT